MDALLLPSGWVEVVEPVEVVVPADDPAFDPVCEEPEAPVAVEAVPVPLGVGVGVAVPCGLWLLAVPLELPAAWLLAVVVPSAVVAVPEPEPCASDELEFVGVVVVFDPVCVVAVPVEGVDPVEEPPAVALAELPVEADADEPPDPDELADVEVFVVVDAPAAPPVAVGEGVGLGVGEGVGLGVGEGVGLGVGVGVAAVDPWEPELLPPPWDEDPELVPIVEVGDGVGAGDGLGVGAGDGLGVGAGAGLGVGVGVCATLVVLVVAVEVVDVVEVPDDPPLIDGSTLMIGCTVMVGE